MRWCIVSTMRNPTQSSLFLREDVEEQNRKCFTLWYSEIEFVSTNIMKLILRGITGTAKNNITSNVADTAVIAPVCTVTVDTVKETTIVRLWVIDVDRHLHRMIRDIASSVARTLVRFLHYSD